MSLILRVIPPEIIDSYNVQSSLAQPIKRLDDKKGAKAQRGRRGRGRAQLSDEDYEGSDGQRSEGGQQDDSDGQHVESEEEEIEEEAEEEYEEEIEEEQEDLPVPEEPTP